jgi:hypothetical protein
MISGAFHDVKSMHVRAEPVRQNRRLDSKTSVDGHQPFDVPRKSARVEVFEAQVSALIEAAPPAFRFVFGIPSRDIDDGR